MSDLGLIADRHHHDPARANQPNRWLGMDTCECACGCGFAALGRYFNQPLCDRCQRNEPDWMAADAAGAEMGDLASPLDAAWNAVEAALPEGWQMTGLRSTALMSPLNRWEAEAGDRRGPVIAWKAIRTGLGPTPVLALQALADALRAARPGSAG